MKALVTGGAGFIGSHITERLVREGHDVTVLDNFSTGKQENLLHLQGRVDVVEGDVRDLPRLDYLLGNSKVDVIFHQAAIVSVPYSVEHPQETHDVNLQGTLNVLLTARRRGVGRVVFAGSAAVYGDDPELPKRESMRATPTAPYGVEKLASELYLAACGKLYGVETVTLRYFNVFGPRQDPSSPYSGVISLFVNRALRGEKITIFGDGKQSRDFVFIDDVVEANMRAATVPGISGKTFNVAAGKETTLEELVNMLERVIGKPVERAYAERRSGDIYKSLADISTTERELGYEPRVTVEGGLSRLVAHLRGSTSATSREA
jgi:UDP-glucose 4-epimerase